MSDDRIADKLAAHIDLETWGKIDAIVLDRSLTIQDRMEKIDALLSDRRRKLDVLRITFGGDVAPAIPGIQW